jgi:hypothetical protein
MYTKSRLPLGFSTSGTHSAIQLILCGGYLGNTSARLAIGFSVFVEKGDFTWAFVTKSLMYIINQK